MRTLEQTLQAIPAVYADLLDATQPQRTGQPPESKDPRDRPAPGNLAVLDHRHELVRGLRWWVDAVAPNPADRPTIVGGNIGAMCRLLLRHLPAMAEEDRAELDSNLRRWLARAWGMLDRAPLEAGESLTARLPLGAWEQTVKVATAAEVLGCTVRTIQRRVPVERRPGGRVLLADAGRCELCDLPGGQCAHTRAQCAQ